MNPDTWATRITLWVAGLSAALYAVRKTWRGLRKLGALSDAFFGSDETGPGVFARQAAAEERDQAMAARIEELADLLANVISQDAPAA